MLRTFSFVSLLPLFAVSNIEDPSSALDTSVQFAPPALETDHSIAVRFIPVTGNSEKMPKFRASISLPGGMAGLVLESPIFKDGKTGKFSVAVPGGRFAAVKAEPQTIQHGGKTLVLAESMPEGQRKLDRWESAILTAFYAYETTGKAEQRITL